MPTNETKDTRRVKRVMNAINNPVSTVDNLAAALDGVKHIRVYQDEIDAWVQKALSYRRYDMVLEIFNKSQVSLVKSESAVLRLFIFKHQCYLKQFVESNAFDPTNPSHSIMVIGKCEKFKELEYFFSLPRTGHILTEIRKVISLENYKFYTFLATKNPDLQKKQKLTKVLLRFWLLTVKRMIPRWKNSLYYPGSGALYLKAFTSFKRNLPFMLTCV